MRILHVINSLATGGAERLLADLLPRLATRGLECAVLALDARGDVFSAGLAAAGIEVSFAREGGASPYAPARLADVRKAIRRRAPDVVHAHLAPSFHWCALAGLSVRGTAFVATEHAVANRRMASPILRPFERWCHGCYDRIACVSPEAASALQGWLGIDPGRMKVIPNGVEMERLSAEATPDAELAAWAAGKRLLAMTARLVPAKDYATALAALALLPEEYVMAFAGEGPLRTALEAEAKRLGVSGRCRFLGSRSDIPSVLGCAEAYLQTSREEGFGIACLEAMAAGLPVAASEAGGLGPLVRGAGALFPVGDAAACAAAARRVCEDGRFRSAAIESGRARAAAHSMDTTAAAYAALYAELRGAR